VSLRRHSFLSGQNTALNIIKKTKKNSSDAQLCSPKLDEFNSKNGFWTWTWWLCCEFNFLLNGELDFRANVAWQAPAMVAVSAASSAAGTGTARQGNGTKVIPHAQLPKCPITQLPNYPITQLPNCPMFKWTWLISYFFFSQSRKEKSRKSVLHSWATGRLNLVHFKDLELIQCK